MRKKIRACRPTCERLEGKALLSISITQLAPYQGLKPYVEVKDTTPGVSGTLTWSWGDSNPNPILSTNFYNFFGATYDFVTSQTHNYAPNGFYTINISVSDSSGDSASLLIPVNTYASGSPQLTYDRSNPPTLNADGSSNDVVGDLFTVDATPRNNESIQTIDWWIENVTEGIPDVYSKQVITKTGGFINTPFGNAQGILAGAPNQAIAAYWGPVGGTVDITATLHYLDGTQDTLTKVINLQVPQSTMTSTFGNPSYSSIQVWPSNDITISTGFPATGIPTVAGNEWTTQITPTDIHGFTVDGTQAVVQVINSSYSGYTYYDLLGGYWETDFYTNPDGSRANFPLLDDLANQTTPFYGGDSNTSLASQVFRSSDTPNLSISVPVLVGTPWAVWDNTSFTQTLMFQPSGPIGKGIYVPLGSQSWGFYIEWFSKGGDNPLWVVQSPKLTAAYASTTTYPTWADLGSNWGPPNAPSYTVKLY